MSKPDLDQMRLAYKKAVDEWVDAIRAEEALATPDHSMVAMEHWDTAHFAEHMAHDNAAKAREAYKDGLRQVNYGIQLRRSENRFIHPAALAAARSALCGILRIATRVGRTLLSANLCSSTE